jgi:hypothetical protein
MTCRAASISAPLLPSFPEVRLKSLFFLTLMAGDCVGFWSLAVTSHAIGAVHCVVQDFSFFVIKRDFSLKRKLM